MTTIQRQLLCGILLLVLPVFNIVVFAGIIADLNTGTDSANPSPVGELNGKLFMLADSEYGIELFFWEKAGGAPEFRFEIESGPESSGFRDRDLAFDGLAVIATDKTEVWHTTGVKNESTRLFQTSDLNGNSIPSIRSCGGSLFFAVNSIEHGLEVYSTDSLENPPKLVKDILPGPQGALEDTPPLSSGADFVCFDNEVYFAANDGVTGRELWKSDGTTEGTLLAHEFVDGIEGAFIGGSSLGPVPVSPRDFVNENFFVLNGFFRPGEKFETIESVLSSFTEIDFTKFTLSRVMDSGAIYLDQDFNVWFTDLTIQGTRILLTSDQWDRNLTAVGDKLFYLHESALKVLDIQTNVVTLLLQLAPFVSSVQWNAKGKYLAANISGRGSSYLINTETLSLQAIERSDNQPWEKLPFLLYGSDNLVIFAAQQNDLGVEPWIYSPETGEFNLFFDVNQKGSGSIPFDFSNDTGGVGGMAVRISDSNAQIWAVDDGQLVLEGAAALNQLANSRFSTVFKNDRYFTANEDGQGNYLWRVPEFASVPERISSQSFQLRSIKGIAQSKDYLMVIEDSPNGFRPVIWDGTNLQAAASNGIGSVFHPFYSNDLFYYTTSKSSFSDSAVHYWSASTGPVTLAKIPKIPPFIGGQGGIVQDRSVFQEFKGEAYIRTEEEVWYLGGAGVAPVLSNFEASRVRITDFLATQNAMYVTVSLDFKNTIWRSRGRLQPFEELAIPDSSGEVLYVRELANNRVALFGRDSGVPSIWILSELPGGKAEKIFESWDLDFGRDCFEEKGQGYYLSSELGDKGYQLHYLTDQIEDFVTLTAAEALNCINLVDDQLVAGLDDGIHGIEPWLFEFGTVGFVASEYVANESGREAIFTLNRSGSALTGAKVIIKLISDSAVLGQDFIAPNDNGKEKYAIAEWAPGEYGEKTVAIELVDDQINEGNEGFDIEIIRASGEEQILLSKASVKIVDNDDSIGQSSVSVTNPIDGGKLVVSTSGGGGTCQLTTVEVIDAANLPPVSPATLFPYGVISFVAENCTFGSTVTVSVEVSENIAPNAQIMKYGPTLENQTLHWYSLPMEIDGNTANFIITDGALGDSDLAVNGLLIDPVGIAVPSLKIDARQVPILTDLNLALLSLLIGITAFFRLRMQKPKKQLCI